MIKPHGLMFHHFHGGVHENDKCGSISGEDFDFVLKESGLGNIVRPEEWIEGVTSEELSSRHLCITFDDCLKSQFDVALPILDKYGLKAFWFVYSAPYSGEFPRLEIFRRFRTKFFHNIDDYYKKFFQKAFKITSFSRDNFFQWCINMRTMFPFYSENDLLYRYFRDKVFSPNCYCQIVEEMIREVGLTLKDLAANIWLTESDLRNLINSGHQVGLHSHSHPTVLSALSYHEQASEYKRNADFIRGLGQLPLSMSHPCNSYNMETLIILAELGIKIGFRSNMKETGVLLGKFSCLQVAREDVANILRVTKTNVSQNKSAHQGI